MLPAQVDDTNHPTHHEAHHQQATREHCDDVSMECEATVIDPEDNNTHDSVEDSQHNNDNTNGHNTPIIDINLTMANSSQNKSPQPRQHTRDGHTSNTISDNIFWLKWHPPRIFVHRGATATSSCIVLGHSSRPFFPISACCSFVLGFFDKFFSPRVAAVSCFG
jgi:hypothetical protein